MTPRLLTPLMMLLAITLLVGTLPSDAARYYRGGVNRTVSTANQLLMQGHFQKAEAVLQSALEKDPSNLEIRSSLAIVQAELYKLEAAERNAQKVLTTAPNNAQAHLALGKVNWYRTASSDMTYRSQRQALLTQAENHLRRAAEEGDGMPEAHNALGELLLQQNRYQEAQASLAKALELDPHYGDALVNMGEAQQRQGNSTEALKYFDKAIASNSKNPRAHYFKGAALVDSGRYHEGLKALNNALYLHRNAPHVLNKMGEAYLAQGNQAAALTQFRKATQLKPEYSPAYQNLANLLHYRGDGELAVAELRSALNVKPGYTPYLEQIGQLSLAIDKPDQAIESYSQALRLDPSNAEAAKGLASAYQRSAERVAANESLAGSEALIAAEQQLMEAIRLSPDNMELRLALLKVQKATGASDLDTTQLESLVARPATTEGERLTRAEALLTLGRFQEADAEVEQLLAQQSSTPQRLRLAEILVLSGDTANARKVYNAILTSEPTSVSAERGLNRLSRLENRASKSLQQARSNNHWYSRKDRLSAKSLYEEAVELNPRLSDARLELGRLYERHDEYQNALIEYRAYLQLNPQLEESERRSIERRISRLEERVNRPTSSATALTLPWN